MKKFFSVFVLFLLVFSANAFADTYTGDWWDNGTHYYSVGVFNGNSYGVSVSFVISAKGSNNYKIKWRLRSMSASGTLGTSDLVSDDGNKEHNIALGHTFSSDNYWFYVVANGSNVSCSNDDNDRILNIRSNTLVKDKADYVYVYIAPLSITLESAAANLCTVSQVSKVSTGRVARDVKVYLNGVYQGKQSGTLYFPSRDIKASDLKVSLKNSTDYTYNVTASGTTYNVNIFSKYSVKFDGNGATSGSMSNQAFVYGTAQNLTSNAYAKTATVTFNANGGSCSTSSTNVGFSFSGWKYGSNTYSNGQSVSNLTTTAGSVVTLVAQWVANNSITLPSATRTRYKLNGWKNASGSIVGKAGAAYTPSGTETLTADWSHYSYTVKYDANGGSGSMSSVTHECDVVKALSSSGFTRANYKFLSWNTAADGSGTSYAPGQSVTNLSTSDGATVTLYAIWEKLSYKLTVNVDGLSGDNTAVVKVSGPSVYTLFFTASSASQTIVDIPVGDYTVSTVGAKTPQSKTVTVSSSDVSTTLTVASRDAAIAESYKVNVFTK